MPVSSPIILILGAGSRIGFPVANLFASKGYRVAVAARSLLETDSTPSQLNITADLSNPTDVIRAFTRTRQELGYPPNVVLFNASAMTPTPPKDPFAISVEAFKNDMNLTSTNAFLAAQQAVQGFAELPAELSKTFLFTGNILNVSTLPGFITQGAAKSAAAHMMMAAAAAYADRGFKFYYVDERKTDGSAAFRVDGEAHGKMFWELVEGKSQGPWLQTFVKGEGYKNFNSNYQG